MWQSASISDFNKFDKYICITTNLYLLKLCNNTVFMLTVWRSGSVLITSCSFMYVTFNGQRYSQGSKFKLQFFIFFNYMC
jgi:hypothetical protein